MQVNNSVAFTGRYASQVPLEDFADLVATDANLTRVTKSERSASIMERTIVSFAQLHANAKFALEYMRCI